MFSLSCICVISLVADALKAYADRFYQAHTLRELDYLPLELELFNYSSVCLDLAILKLLTILFSTNL